MPSRASLVVNTFVGASTLPLVVAETRGYFARQGLSVELVRTANSDEYRGRRAHPLGPVLQYPPRPTPLPLLPPPTPNKLATPVHARYAMRGTIPIRGTAQHVSGTRAVPGTCRGPHRQSRDSAPLELPRHRRRHNRGTDRIAAHTRVSSRRGGPSKR